MGFKLPECSSISPELKIEPDSHQVLSGRSLREIKYHLLSQCNMQDLAPAKHMGLHLTQLPGAEGVIFAFLLKKKPRYQPRDTEV